MIRGLSANDGQSAICFLGKRSAPSTSILWVLALKSCVSGRGGGLHVRLSCVIDRGRRSIHHLQKHVLVENGGERDAAGPTGTPERITMHSGRAHVVVNLVCSCTSGHGCLYVLSPVRFECTVYSVYVCVSACVSRVGTGRSQSSWPIKRRQSRRDNRAAETAASNKGNATDASNQSNPASGLGISSSLSTKSITAQRMRCIVGPRFAATERLASNVCP